MTRHVSSRGLSGRDPGEPHRVATTLELFFDLVFVVAIAAAASGLHHAVAEGHVADGVLKFAVIFLAIWWPWLNFSWFASAFDNDDAPYRVLVFLLMAGVLVLTAGVEAMYESFDVHLGLGGYLIMRTAMIALWLRAAHDCPARRNTALAYVIGIAVCQIGWTVLILFGSSGAWFYPLFAALWLCEFAVPVIAERQGGTPWHPHHIAERYGLMTIVVLGEGVLSSSLAVNAAARGAQLTPALTGAVGGALIILFSMWWLYFSQQSNRRLETLRGAFVWGYLHYFVFASAAAVGAGVAAFIDQTTSHAEINRTGAALAVAVPAATYLVAIWIVHAGRGGAGWRRAVLPLAAALVLAGALAPFPLLAVGAALAAAVVILERARSGRPSD
jgi:low temperature requirement protein LtrA